MTYLSKRDLVHAGRVNHVWYLVSLDHIHLELLWKDTGSAEERAKALGRLMDARVTLLRLEAQDSRTYLCFGANVQEQIQAAWEQLHQAMRDLVTLPEKSEPITGTLPMRTLLPRLKTLALYGQNCVNTHITPVLDCFPTLTTLLLTGMTPGVVDLTLILQKCNHLVEFTLCGTRTMFTTAHRNVCLGSMAPSSFTADNLRRIRLHHVAVEQSTIETLVEATPLLHTLDLRYLVKLTDRPSAIDRNLLIHHVKNVCPQLKVLHLSILDETMQPSEAKLLGTFFSGSSSALVWDVDLTPDNTPLLLQPHDDINNNNRLTTLEIHHLPGGPTRIQKQKNALHDVLCTSPFLLHLKIENLPYPGDYIIFGPNPSPKDPSDIPSRSKDRQELSRPDLLPTGLNKRIWACRNLRTLSFQMATHNAAISHISFEMRATFAYLATVCPRLRKLELHRGDLDLSLASGLCHLAALRELEHLTLSSPSLPTITLQDLEWMMVIDTLTSSTTTSARGGGKDNKNTHSHCMGDTYPKLLEKWTAQLSKIQKDTPVDLKLSRFVESRQYHGTNIRHYSARQELDDLDPLEMIALPSIHGVLDRLTAIFRGDYATTMVSSTKQQSHRKCMLFDRQKQAQGTLRTLLPCWPRLESFQITATVSANGGLVQCHDALIAALRPDIISKSLNGELTTMDT
ncbi:hypothetical protein BGZ94_004338 [Podila epigama]|nr:hypothetical protein BGZ94_004338 [Podila epigama]